MTLHELFTLLNLPIGKSGHDMTQPLSKIKIGVQYIRYTSEYIPKLQLHQHPSSYSYGDYDLTRGTISLTYKYLIVRA